MKILSIGNSFSQDAQRYLHKLAKADGTKMKTVNLYIGGCSLRRHYINMLDNNADYDFEFNGEKTGIKVSIAQALASDEWDFVTLQQQSAQSTRYETFSPYLEALADTVRKYAPHTKILMHQTWAYEGGSEKLRSLSELWTPDDMLSAIRDSYEKAERDIGAYGIIPSGEAMMAATKLGIEKIHRDTFHASLGAGRYLLALCWYKTLTEKDISNNSFSDFDVPITDEEKLTVIKAVDSVITL